MLGVREQGRVSRAIDDAEIRWSGADLVWQAIQWTLARDPHAGVALNSSGSLRGFIFEGARSRDMPTAEVVYRIEADNILVEDIVFKDSQYAQAGRA